MINVTPRPFYHHKYFHRLLRRLIGCLTLLLFLAGVGCSERQTEDQPPVIQGPPPFALHLSLDEVSLPKNLTCLIGVNQINELSELISSQVTSFKSTPLDLRSLWLDTYVQTEFLFQAKFLHVERPLRILQFITNQGIQDVRIIGVIHRDELISSLGDYLETKIVEGKTIYVQKRYKSDRHPLHFVFLDHDLIASSYDLSLLSGSYLDTYSQLGHVKLEGLVQAVVYPSRLPPILGGRASHVGIIENLPLHGSTASVARQKGMLLKGLSLAEQVRSDLEYANIKLLLDQASLVISTAWGFRPESLSHTFIKKLKGGEHVLAQELDRVAALISLQLPENPLQNFIEQLNLEILSPREIRKISALPMPEGIKRRPSSFPALMGQSDQHISDYVNAASLAAEQLTGELVFAAYQNAPVEKKETFAEGKTGNRPLSDLVLLEKTSSPFHWVSLFGHHSRDRFTSHLAEVLSLYGDPEVKRALRKRGVAVSISEEHLEGVQGVVMHFQSRMKRVPTMLRSIKSYLQKLYQSHVWVGDRRGVIVFSEEWDKTLRLLSEAKPTKLTDQDVHQALLSGESSPFLFLYFDPVRWFSGLKRGLPGSMTLPLQMMFSQVKPSGGVSLTAAHSGGAIKVQIAFPKKLLETIRNALTGGAELLPYTSPVVEPLPSAETPKEEDAKKKGIKDPVDTSKSRPLASPPQVR